MPGFGSNPFGQGTFGHFDRLLDGLYARLRIDEQRQDAAQGYPLRRLFRLLDRVHQLLQSNMDEWSALRSPFTARARYENNRPLRLGRVIDRLGPIEQSGINGKVQTFGIFEAQSARFSEADLNKNLTIRRATTSVNETEVRIIGVVSPTLVVVDPGLPVDPGPLRWSLRSRQSLDTGRIDVEVLEGDVRDLVRGWLLDDGDTVFTIRGRRMTLLGGIGDPVTERSYRRGEITSTGFYLDVEGAFQRTDVGARVVVWNPAEPETRGETYLIRRVISATALELETLERADAGLSQNAGPLELVFMPRPVLTLESTVPPRGVVLYQGRDLTVTTASQVEIPSGDFDSALEGALLEIRGSEEGNDGLYPISSVPGATTLNIETPALSSESDSLSWWVRTSTAVPPGTSDNGQVVATQNGTLSALAEDIGLTLDTVDTPERQRGWVAHANRWYDVKGLESAYEALGLLSGFVVDASALWSVDYTTSLGLPAESLLEIGATEVGRSGTDGALAGPGVGYGAGGAFASTTAAFTDSDVGSFIRIRDAATLANNTSFLIESIAASGFIAIISPLTPVTGVSDANNGALRWNITKLYTTLPPLAPRFDDIQGELLSDIVDSESAGALFFSLDRYCWEDDFSTDVPLSIDAVQQVSISRWRVTVSSAAAGFPEAPEVVSRVEGGLWRITDSGGTSHVLETVPTGGPPAYTFEVVATSAPALGAATLAYTCPLTLGCGFCPSSSVLIDVEFGAIAEESGRAIERATERLLERFEEVKPIHVRLVPRFKAELTATIGFGATVEVSAETGQEIVAYLVNHFDEVPADATVLDGALFIATIETP